MKIRCIKVNKQDSMGFVVGNVYEVVEGNPNLVESETGKTQVFYKKDIAYINLAVTGGLVFEEVIEPQPKFKLGDKVVPIKKSVGSKEMNEGNKEFLDENGYLIYNGRTTCSDRYGAACVSWEYVEGYPTGDFYLESELIPYVEPNPTLKQQFLIQKAIVTLADGINAIVLGKKLISVDSGQWLTNIDEYDENLVQIESLYVEDFDIVKIEIDGKVVYEVKPKTLLDLVFQEGVGIVLRGGDRGVVDKNGYVADNNGDYITKKNNFNEDLTKLYPNMESFEIIKATKNGVVIYEVDTKLEEAQTLLDELNRIDRALEDLQKEKDKLNKDFENIDELIEDLGFEVRWDFDKDKYVIIK